MPHFKFPSHYIHWGQVKDHENIKSKLLPIINSLISDNNYKNPFEACSMTTNFSKKTDFIDDEMKHKILGTHLDEMILETNCFPHIKVSEFLITDYWFNVYEKGDFQEMHRHRGVPLVVGEKRYDSTLSIIYILNSDEEENSTVFKIDNADIPFYPMLKECEFKTSIVKEIKEGTLMIFSNELGHYVLPVKQPGRITIAFNVACRFE